jgi:hypothetical protein
LTIINNNLRSLNGKIQSICLPRRYHFAVTGHIGDLRDGHRAQEEIPGVTATGGQAVTGGASITTPNPVTTFINQGTDKAKIDWNSFSIGSNELVKVTQPGAASPLRTVWRKWVWGMRGGLVRAVKGYPFLDNAFSLSPLLK